MNTINEDVVETTIRTYEETAEEYTQTHFDISRVKDLADFFIQNLRGNKILDAGCGPGRDAKYFSENGLEVIGVDLSENFIKIASQNVPNAKFFKMDIRKLDFPENTFDGIWACASFLHIPKKDAKDTLLGFRRVLKPGGLVFISVKSGSGEGFVRKEEDRGLPKFYAFYSEDELKNLVEACGFEIMKIMSNKTKDIDNQNIETTWLTVFAIKK